MSATRPLPISLHEQLIALPEILVGEITLMLGDLWAEGLIARVPMRGKRSPKGGCRSHHR